MGDADGYIELVRKAQHGDEVSLNCLAGLARERVRTYLYRLTLDEGLTEDIVQETMLEMSRFLGQLENAESFWIWLCRIATNKMNHYYKKERRRKTVSTAEIDYARLTDGGEDGLAKAIGEELKQAVVASMSVLKPQYRTVLALRCYEEMSFSEIAQVMGCSVFGSRMLFQRAKKALLKQLSRRGLGRAALVLALVLYGKLTAPSKAVAAAVSVTSASVNAGLTAGLAAAVTSKAVIASVGVAAVLATGMIVTPSWLDKVSRPPRQQQAVQSYSAPGKLVRLDKEGTERWYYFPEGTNGPVMIRVLKPRASGNGLVCLLRQNQDGNYYFDERSNTVYLENWHAWNSDLSVVRLPTDNYKLTRFLSRVEGRPDEMEYIGNQGAALLVIARRRKDEDNYEVEKYYQHNVLDEEYFRYNWPAGVEAVDNRDAMHKRGWTFFRIEGQVNGSAVKGAGCLPFVYAEVETHRPWLRMTIGNDVELVDGGGEARVYRNGQMVARYTGGNFFAGLSKPWLGLHSLDTVRRDAAASCVWFETQAVSSNKVQVVLRGETTQAVYCIDMEKDLIEKIDLWKATGRCGEIKFHYLQQVEGAGSEFAEPVTAGYTRQQLQNPGVNWLLELSELDI